MSRIEKNQPVMEGMEEMKGEILGAVGRKPRFGWKARASLVLLVLLFSLIGYALWVLAATGLVGVPVLSRSAYAVPEPARVVGEGVPIETVMMRAMVSSYRPLSLSIHESTLTTELRDALETSGQSLVDPDGAQAAVLADGTVELFLPLRGNARRTAVVARLRLEVENGAPKAVAEEASVGSWKMGPWLRDGLVNPAVNGMIGSTMGQMGASVSLASIRAEEGVLAVITDFP